HFDIVKHLTQISGYRNFLDRIRQFSVLDPQPHRAARVVSGNAVHTKSDQLNHVKTGLHRPDDLFGTVRARFQIEISGTNRHAGSGTARIAGRPGAELARAVGSVEIVLQNSVFDDGSSLSRNAFVIERRGAEAAGKTRVIDDRHVGRGDVFADAVDE